MTSEGWGNKRETADQKSSSLGSRAQKRPWTRFLGSWDCGRRCRRGGPAPTRSKTTRKKSDKNTSCLMKTK